MTLPSTPASSRSMSVAASRFRRGWVSVSNASTTGESAFAAASRTLDTSSGPAMDCRASRIAARVAGSRTSSDASASRAGL